MLKNRQELNMQVKILVFSLLWSLTLGCKSSPPPPPKESCDYCPECARVNTGHIGGSSNFATIKDFPWMASFGYEENGKWVHYCGGAVIFDTILITAAHCFYHQTRGNATIRKMTKVRLGDQNLNDGIDDDHTYDIEKIIPHHSYEGRGPQFDLAMVYTKSKITFNDQIRPICLPTKHYDEANRYANNEVKFSGWGYYDAVSDFSNDLREATFKVLPESECFSTDLYLPRQKYKDIFFCAGNENEINWSCTGDSGSPLVKTVYPESGHPYFKLVGILHGSKSNCNIRPRTEASMFANLENSKNHYFIQRNQPASKILVATGSPLTEAKKVEVIDLVSPSKSCTLSNFPIRLGLAIGAFTPLGPTICSGYNTSSRIGDCFTLKSNGGNFLHSSDVTLNTPRSSASGFVSDLGDLIISGGYDNGNNNMNSGEIIYFDQNNVDDFVLKEKIGGHCSVLVNASTAMILGGRDGGSSSVKSTYFLNLNTFKVTDGPKMQERRSFFGCAVFEQNKHKFVIAAGSWYPALKSTEIFNLETEIWTTGPQLPVKMSYFPLVSTSIGILAVGGWDYTNRRDKNEVVKLQCPEGQDVSACRWITHSQQLQIARHDHVVIPLPSSYEICDG